MAEMPSDNHHDLQTLLTGDCLNGNAEEKAMTSGSEYPAR